MLFYDCIHPARRCVALTYIMPLNFHKKCKNKVLWSSFCRRRNGNLSCHPTTDHTAQIQTQLSLSPNPVRVWWQRSTIEKGSWEPWLLFSLLLWWHPLTGCFLCAFHHDSYFFFFWYYLITLRIQWIRHYHYFRQWNRVTENLSNLPKSKQLVSTELKTRSV